MLFERKLERMQNHMSLEILYLQITWKASSKLFVLKSFYILDKIIIMIEVKADKIVKINDFN